MAVVEPTLNREKIARLLDEGAESETLDYKTTCDLSARGDLVEIAKDFGAMQAEGGYIVVGADDSGVPTGGLDRRRAGLFDEATLRDKLKRYVPEPFDLRTAVCEIDGKLVAAIGTTPNPAGLVAFRADGTYDEAGKPKTAFRRGDVYVRHGSKSERCEQADIARAVDRLVAGRKEAWLAEHVRTTTALLEAGALGRAVAAAPSQSFSWRLDQEAFASAAFELVRARDLAPVLSALDRMKHDLARYVGGDPDVGDDELAIVLDRLACVAAVGVRLADATVFPEALRTLRGVYALGFAPATIGRAHEDRRAPRLWLEVATRVLALGGLAVRLERWDDVRSLALERPGAALARYADPTPWLRHALTAAANAGLLREPGAPARNTGVLVTLATGAADRAGCLRPEFPPASDAVLDSILQFDLLAAIVVMVELGSRDTSNWYPSFGFWNGWRSEPALIRLISDPSVRLRLLGRDVPDKELLPAVWSAGGNGRDISHNFHGWESPAVAAFFEPVRDWFSGKSGPPPL